MMKRLTILACCLTLTMAATAQKKESVQIQMLARPQQQGILLRWAVTTPQAWRLTNQYGFELIRYTVVRDGKVLDNPEQTRLSTQPIRPKPLPEWEQIVNRDGYAAIIAQALYGKDFEVSAGAKNDVAQIINQSQEMEQRFSLSLYAADNSFEAAKHAGWGWEDKTARPTEKYLYRIRSLVPVQRLRIDSSGVYTGMMDYQELPKPAEPGALFGDKHVVLSWDYTLLKSYYNAWFVERSADGGKTFQKASNLPVTNLNEKSKKPSPRMYYIDSLENNTSAYQYRVRGVSPFGEVGPPSVPVSGKGKHLLVYVPNIRSNNIDEKGSMELNWEFEEAGNTLISGFILNQASTADGPYQPVLQQIPVTARSLRFDQLQPTNYFTITAVAKEGEPATSFPVLVQPIDSVPPAAPAGLAGTIDSAGVVHLTWQPNSEKDMLGYKIFRANTVGEELSPLVDSVYEKTSFRDSVGLRSLNSKVYYAVTAFDQRFNQSAYSVMLELKKPDVIPPTSPVFSNYKVENNQVKLYWVPSSSADVAAHVLYRKAVAEGNEKWELLQSIPAGKEGVYHDASGQGGASYAYLLLAKDSSGLESAPTPPLSVSIPVDPAQSAIDKLQAYVNREQRYIELSWSFKDAGAVEEYQLYRGEKGKPVTLWKIVKADSKRLADDQPKINTTYEYGIRAVLKSGAQGQYKTITVAY